MGEKNPGVDGHCHPTARPSPFFLLFAGAEVLGTEENTGDIGKLRHQSTREAQKGTNFWFSNVTSVKILSHLTRGALLNPDLLIYEMRNLENTHACHSLAVKPAAQEVPGHQ